MLWKYLYVCYIIGSSSTQKGGFQPSKSSFSQQYSKSVAKPPKTRQKGYVLHVFGHFDPPKVADMAQPMTRIDVLIKRNPKILSFHPMERPTKAQCGPHYAFSSVNSFQNFQISPKFHQNQNLLQKSSKLVQRCLTRCIMLLKKHQQVTPSYPSLFD